MMTNYFALFGTIFSLLFLVFFIFWPYRYLRIDIFRQKMFSLRDELFDQAVTGKLKFDSDAYRLLRNAMNGSIRFGHRISVFNGFLLTVVYSKKPDTLLPFSKRLESALANCSTEQAQLINSFRNRMNSLLIEHAVKISPLFLATIIPLALFIATAKFLRLETRRSFAKSLDQLDSVAFEEGIKC